MHDAAPPLSDHTVTALVTGFEPFDGARLNPSWEAVRLLPGELALAHGTLVVHRERLPVTFAGAAGRVRELLAQLRPDVVVLVGLDAGARVVRLETTARNLAQARIPDNAGHRPRGEVLVPGGPPRRYATWSASTLAGRLRAAGHAVEVCDDAGLYVCNATLYAALEALEAGGRTGVLTGFVHVPGGAAGVDGVGALLTALLTELADQVRRRRAWRHGVGRASVPRAGRPLRVGLTGGIGSGKSTVARLLARRDATVVDADAISRRVTGAGGAVLGQIRSVFGDGVITADGALDRSAMAGLIFSDPSARRRLESLTLPRIALEAAQEMERAGAGGVAVYDVPLLVEQGMADLFDVVVVVESPLEQRLERLERRGLERAEAMARMASQASDEARRALADVVLINNGTEADLADGVNWLWDNRLSPPRRLGAADRSA